MLEVHDCLSCFLIEEAIHHYELQVVLDPRHGVAMFAKLDDSSSLSHSFDARGLWAEGADAAGPGCAGVPGEAKHRGLAMCARVARLACVYPASRAVREKQFCDHPDGDGFYQDSFALPLFRNCSTPGCTT
jgi:hypothetical protein